MIRLLEFCCHPNSSEVIAFYLFFFVRTKYKPTNIWLLFSVGISTNSNQIGQVNEVRIMFIAADDM